MSIAPEIIVRLQKNDQEAQRLFWSSQWSYVFAICAHILGKGAAATDLAVDVLTAFMFEYVHGLAHPATAKVYLRLMAVRRSLQKRKEQRVFVDLQNWETLVEEGARTPEDQALCRAAMPRLEGCLSRLSPNAQQIIRLSYTQGMGNNRIADLLGVSKQYIGKLIKKSLERLRRCMEEPIPGEGRKGEGA